MSIGCLTEIFVACVIAASAVVIIMAAAFQINRARADTNEVAEVLAKLKAAHAELRLISEEDAIDLRTAVDRLQDTILTIQLQK